VRATDGVEVHREIHISGERLIFFGLEVDGMKTRVRWTCRTNDFGIELTWIPSNRTIAHMKTAVEREIIFRPGGVAQPGRPEFGVRFFHSSRDQRRQAVGVFLRERMISAEGVETAPARENRAGMRMGCADHHVFAGNAGFLLNDTPRFFNGAPQGADQIKSYEGCFRFARFDHNGFGFEWIMSAFGPALGIITGHRSAELRCDVDPRGARFEILRVD
jgi:hypothetical protein